MPTFSAKRIIVPALFLILIGFLPSLVWLYSTYFAPKFGGWLGLS